MQPRPSFDRTFMIPIVISIVSILGICLILLTSRLDKKVLDPTAIPINLSSLEAATRTSFPSATPTQNEIPPTATGTSPDAYPGPAAETPPATSTEITVSLPPPSATYTPAQIQSLRVGKHDDMDPNIAYDPSWRALKNPTTENAYRGTLHASTDTGNEASFRFTGKRFRLGYQRGNNFGTVTVIIDDEPYSFHEQAYGLVWLSPPLSSGDHFVQIIHDSGESINLDYIEIMD